VHYYFSKIHGKILVTPLSKGTVRGNIGEKKFLLKINHRKYIGILFKDNQKQVSK